MATDSAYRRVCRAHNWHKAQLRAWGIEPVEIEDGDAYEPPASMDFGVPEDTVHLRLVDAGTENECWVICAKGDPDAVPFTAGE